ncbi:DNA polymerase III subunit gamma/tau [Beijerinckiaceae bacterium RH AL1]|nr:DNA polymerase III subunit gamma/tau [Beijerinckiaceae bacterium RH AL8]VVB42112.1 DNA polymerase III subunit gamma/tau [Beijerinckiaceae bacterium RH CH11]VVC53143.1 DNA polymerase III subunit gamma/tau [Beijerinckiaceae bacterium RH AL1]
MSDGLLPDDAGPAEGLGKLFADQDKDLASAKAAEPYRVLARKYRPSSFDDLIGQEAMVRTLSNAFELDRIHQAYMLTGVRGVGKTTTARILARAFNYETDSATKPTIRMPELGRHCQAIIESRHVDVIEMDAASHTGIDDVREIIDSARYRPVMARTKIYIIDEVHMLSKQAFNGLLKTLEEPPDHVKFLFATTEIEKVPITVRSRTQRFDLRRIEPQVMVAHLARICAKEGVLVEDEALAVIARAAEGSVRDALSLLDQAIALGAGAKGTLDAASLRAMLGLADRTQVIDLFEQAMKGDMAAALTTLKALHDSGGEPGQILVDLADFVHFVTRLKLVPAAADDPGASPEERVRGKVFASQLSMAVLTRAWQLLLKGVQEVKDAPRPLAAADMVVVRLAYAADLPPPDEVLRRLAQGGAPSGTGAPAPRGPSGSGPRAALAVASSAPRPAVAAPPPSPAVANAVRLHRLEDVVALAAEKRDIQLKTALERDVRLVRFETGTIEFSLAPGASAALPQALMRKLQEWTGERWIVALSRDIGAPTLKEQADAREKEARSEIVADPLVKSVLDAFPGARIVAVRRPDMTPEAIPDAGLAVAAEPVDDGGEDVAFEDMIWTEDEL